METTLYLDCSYLAHRALHSTGALQYNDAATGVLYGFFRDLLKFERLFTPRRVCFCFDSKHSHRRGLYAGYKHKRDDSKLLPAELAAKQELRAQLLALRTTHLPACGYRNIWLAAGYEADDIIAAMLTQTHGRRVVVSNDKDLYQCLGPGITIYDPHNELHIDTTTFQNQWGLPPTAWPHVKALAGCATDDVEGLVGVGEVTAAKYIRGELKTTTKAYKLITSQLGKEILTRNLQLVALPLAGLGHFPIVDDTTTPEACQGVLAALGFKSLYAMETRQGRWHGPDDSSWA